MVRSLGPPKRQVGAPPQGRPPITNPGTGTAPKSASSLAQAADNTAGDARRSLPAAVIDLIRDGTPASELRARGERGVFSALVSTAISAQQRGWHYPDWAAVVEQRNSRLGAQVWLKRGHIGRSQRDFERVLRHAWQRAEKFVAEAEPAYTRRDVVAAITAFRRLITELDLSDAKRAVLEHAADVAEALGTTRPAMPRRAIIEKTGLGLTALRTVLAELDRDGLLVLAIRGQPSGPSAVRRRASCYALAPAQGLHIPITEDRSVVPPASESELCGAPVDEPANYVVPPATSAASEANYVVPPSPAEANYVVPPTALAGEPCGALKTDNGERVGDPPGPQVSEAPQGDMPACRVCGAKLPPGHILCTRVCADTYYRRWAAT